MDTFVTFKLVELLTVRCSPTEGHVLLIEEELKTSHEVVCMIQSFIITL